jgi:NDP-sugar pyrophosphorylase family protein
VINQSLQGKYPHKAYMTDLLQAIIDSGYAINSVQVKSEWVEVDTVSDLNSEITSNRLKKIAELKVG